jgi:hypothetical protein
VTDAFSSYVIEIKRLFIPLLRYWWIKTTSKCVELF